jgi:hypothetical protein
MIAFTFGNARGSEGIRVLPLIGKKENPTG